MIGPLFIASGLEYMSSRERDAPNGLAPTPRLVSGGLPKSPGPKRRWFLSIANSRSSRRILLRARRFEFQREPVAAVELPGLLGLVPLS
jgi:hypothetical protein